MTRTLKQRIRPLIPNVSLRIPHLEPETTLEVRLRQHLGLVARGAKSYESRYVALFRTLMNPGDRVFDVGANIGFYSVLFSRWVGPSGKVLAYEPDAHNVKLLSRNVELNHCENTLIREMAVSDESGEAVFSRDKVTGFTGHLGAGSTYAETIFGKGREFPVEVSVTTLDQEVEQWGPPDLVKLDIEGGEFDALSGGVQLLEQQRPLVISELSSWNDLKPSGANWASPAVKLLTDHDYLLWDIDSGRRIDAADNVWMALGIPKEQVTEPRIKDVLSKFSLSA